MLFRSAAPEAVVGATALNSGSLTVGSTATATGTTAPGEGDSFGARANATVLGGFHQEASLEENTDGAATASSTNSGDFTVFSTATASAVDDAIAEATTAEALYMRASGNGASDASALADLTNSGLLDFSATATGTSTEGDASAVAEAGGGEHGLVHIRARTNGVGLDTADVVVANLAGGEIDISAVATATAAQFASASATGGDGFSDEETSKGSGLVLHAQASGSDDGDVTVSMTNAGSIGFTYTANATSTGAVPVDEDAFTVMVLNEGASATAGANGAIHQIIEAGGPESFIGRTGVASLTNASGATLAFNAAATEIGRAHV